MKDNKKTKGEKIVSYDTTNEVGDDCALRYAGAGEGTTDGGSTAPMPLAQGAGKRTADSSAPRFAGAGEGTTDGEKVNLLERFDMAEYAKLHEAFDFFNNELFKGSLPQVFFTVQRRNKVAGFFRPDSFKERKFNAKGEMLPPGFTVHEIAMMPEVFEFETDREILSTLVHEMTHLQQQEFGNPSRKGYHNKEWAGFMKEVGLQPSTYGKYDCRNPEPLEGKSEIEGKETGQRVSHYIAPNGKFDFACQRLLEGGFTFDFHSVAAEKKKPKKSKYKFTCPNCSINAWAKHGTKLACGNCQAPLEQEEEPEGDS